MQNFLLISLGAVLGANLRYWVGGWAAEKFGAAFPYGTLIVNITGSFVLAFLMTVWTERAIVDPRWRLLLAIGFLGAYTTFSTLTYESVNLMVKGQLWTGALNLVGSAVLGAGAVALGILLGKAV